MTLAVPAILSWLLYSLLYVVPGEGPPFQAWLLSLEPVVGWLWWLRLLLLVAANGLFVAWLYVRYRELARRSVKLRYAPHWAITGCFVPFLNFVRPYQAVADACRIAAVQGRPGGSARRCWWSNCGGRWC